MIRSMTGFGRGEASDDSRTVNVEIKAVNHRYGEISVRMPRNYLFAEEQIVKVARKKISRGKVEINIGIVSEGEEDYDIQVNLPVAKQYFKAFRELQSEFDVRGDITLELLSAQTDVLKKTPVDMGDEAIENAIINVIEKAVSIAIDNLILMREKEGEKLAADVIERVNCLEEHVDFIEKRAPDLTAIYAEKLRNRLEELTAGSVDTSALSERIALESSILADKSDITEELVRLRSHINQLRSMMEKNSEDNGSVGKKIDFLMQEFNREANTIGSKSGDLKISEHMLDMKSEIEKIREQIQNIE